MEKKVTRKEVERALRKYSEKDWKDAILNELFPPEFKVGDWVVGWHFDHKYRENAWQIGGFKKGNAFVVPKEKPNWSTGIEDVRHATPEEIAAAEWEEGKPYKVWIDNDVEEVRISADKVGYFYSCAMFEGDVHKWKNYEKLV